jgi:hypothetical protein
MPASNGTTDAARPRSQARTAQRAAGQKQSGPAYTEAQLRQQLSRTLREGVEFSDRLATFESNVRRVRSELHQLRDCQLGHSEQMAAARWEHRP